MDKETNGLDDIIVARTYIITNAPKYKKIMRFKIALIVRPANLKSLRSKTSQEVKQAI